MEGIVIAVLCGVLGAVVRAAGERLTEAEEVETSVSEMDSLPK
jgi:hypothetical protein